MKTDMTKEELSSLIDKIRRYDDRDAFEKLVRSYEKEVRNYAFQYFKNMEDAKDASQEVWLKVWRGLHRLHKFRMEYGGASFSAWLKTITSNVCFDMAKKKSPKINGNKVVIKSLSEEDLPEILDPSPTPEKIFEQREQIRAVRAAFQKLSPKDQEILRLREIEHKSYQEIAEILSIKLSAAKTRCSRARKALIDILDKECNFSAFSTVYKNRR